MDIPTLATAVWTAVLPLLPLIASKGAEKIGEEAGESLWEAVKEKFDGKPTAKESLDELLSSHEDSDLQAVFRVQLKKLLKEDGDFAKQLEGLLQVTGTSNIAHVEGGGTVVQGDNSVGVGQGGVYIGGNSEGNTIVTGDGNLIEK